MALAPKTITVETTVRGKIVRAWTDLSRKLIAFAATGLTSSGIIYAASLIGIDVPEALAPVIVVLLSTVAGYLISDVAEVPASVTIDATTSGLAPIEDPDLGLEDYDDGTDENPIRAP